VRRWRERGRDVALTDPAVNGYTSLALIEHELPLVTTVRPTLVTVLIGANDIVQGVGEDTYRANLRRIYSRLREARVAAEALYALPQPDWSLSPEAARFGAPDALRARIERYNQVAREEVERVGGTYVDLFPLMRAQAEKRMLAPDGLHPSAEAHAQWAEALEELL
jgi:lysophospholipase L1-like esterase